LNIRFRDRQRFEIGDELDWTGSTSKSAFETATRLAA